VDPDVLKLVTEERLLEAADLAATRGQTGDASALFERACDWARAAHYALLAGESARALELALQAGDEDLAERAAAHTPKEPRAAEGLAQQLERRGHPRWAAQILEGAGLVAQAIAAWERAENPLRAAQLLERRGDPARAARVLEGAMRRHKGDWGLAIALGALLARWEKDEAAVRALQRVPTGLPQRREALARMLAPLRRLGLAGAEVEAMVELNALGGDESDARPETEPPPTELLARYRPRREVASSPTARLLECVDVAGGERVAIKLFAVSMSDASSRVALACFSRHVRGIHALNHPHIVPIRELVEDPPATVLTWMDGGSLDQMLSNGGMAPARAAEIACALLSALGDAHRLGFVHRDVKPANVLFDSAGTARLSDFGTADLGDASATLTSGDFGSLAYVSPEQQEGRPAGVQSDVYAVGVLLWEMLTGRRPSSEPSPLQPSHAHTGLGPQHDAVVTRLRAHRAEERPADAFEARALILALVWPTSMPDHRPWRSPATTDLSPQPEAPRTEVGLDGKLVDLWTGRTIERVALSERNLARARAFALADHPALQNVLRLERPGSVWLSALAGRPLRRNLTPGERTRLRGALAALHAQGLAHGSVDSAHVTVEENGTVTLTFESDDSIAASPESDLEALERL
jgi:serine/threonine protein kinase